MDEVAAKRGRRQLVMLFGIAFVTLGLAWLLFLGARGGMSWGTTNNGEFIDPPTQVDTLDWIDQNGSFSTNNKWWLWMVAENCEADCAATMHDLRSLHTLLNKEANRVARALLTRDGTSGVVTAEEMDKVVLRKTPNALTPGVYIVDPLGNLVFRYSVTTPPKPVLDDLKRLLKLSQIG